MIREQGVSLKQLRALAAVAQHGSISAAAEALHLTASAVHSQIKGLEEAFDVRLLERSAAAAGSRLTAEGRAVLVAATRVQDVLSQAAAEVQAIGRGREARVVLGVGTTARYFVPRLVKMLGAVCPEIEIALRVGNREQVIADLHGLAVDLAIMGRPPRLSAVDAVPLGPHPHGIIAAPDDPLAGRRALSAADLMPRRFLAREEGSGTRLLMARYLDRLGDGQAFDLVEMASNETIKQAVMAGLGIAFLSLHTVAAELRRGDLVLLSAPGLPIVRHWFLVHSTRLPMRPAVERLRGLITGLKGSYLPDLGDLAVEMLP